MEKYYISTGMYERYKQLSKSGPKEIKKIEEFKEYLEKNYIYEVAVFDSYITGHHVCSYQRTEFSKKKYFGYSYDKISLGESCYAKIPEVFCCSDNWEKVNHETCEKKELIEILDYRIENFNKDISALKSLLKIVTVIDVPLLEPTMELSDYDISLLKELEIKEIEPIAPKGNPYAGESWKDKKHKFKGGKRK